MTSRVGGGGHVWGGGGADVTQRHSTAPVHLQRGLLPGTFSASALSTCNSFPTASLHAPTTINQADTPTCTFCIRKRIHIHSCTLFLVCSGSFCYNVHVTGIMHACRQQYATSSGAACCWISPVLFINRICWHTLLCCACGPLGNRITMLDCLWAVAYVPAHKGQHN